MKFEKWEIKGYDRAVAARMTRSGLNPLVAVTLASRGITTTEEAEAFQCDDFSLIADPFLLKDMDRAVDRIQKAINNGEHIAIYGDYDVDGMTSSCLLASFFRAKGVEAEIYIPGRMDEGYGLNAAALDALAARGVTLVITVDCGITACREADYARSIGLDLIITDHHACKSEMPQAVAVVDPKQQDCPSPNKSLAGVGVAFMLVCALEKSRSMEYLLETYGDLVAIGTIADVMPVVGENRVLIRRGMMALNKKTRPGLRRLMRVAGLESRAVSVSMIGYNLAPRLNAAGRMGRTSLTVDLLLTESEDEADRLASELTGLNSERRQLEADIFEQAQAALAASRPVGPVVLANRGWYQGVMGIVAARIAEQFFYPTIMISVDDDGMGRGSCRSIGRFCMYAALESCSDLLENYGGHEMAAGLTIAEENIDAFRERLLAIYSQMVTQPCVSSLFIDFEVIKPELLSLENITALERFEPFGNGFLMPVFCLRAATLTSVTPVGGGKHTKMRVLKNGKVFDCILFGTSADDLSVSRGALVDLAFEAQVNEYRAWRSVQLHVLDIRPHMELG
ncbi:single-stranded-DNA-specific exonuclease RecJ [Oscillospiraceae bacterium CM]|nr:single-stranded-DNA-specific exonuclease RecJ [Oscillospiraceae bacterium CM]